MDIGDIYFCIPLEWDGLLGMGLLLEGRWEIKLEDEWKNVLMKMRLWLLYPGVRG